MRRLKLTATVEDGDRFSYAFATGMGRTAALTTHEWSSTTRLQDDLTLDQIDAALVELRDRLGQPEESA